MTTSTRIVKTEIKICKQCNLEREHFPYNKYMCKYCWSKYKKGRESARAIIKERKYTMEKRKEKQIPNYKIKQREYVLKLRQDLINYLGGCCSSCGYSKSIYALEFHHKNPTDKEFGIGAFMNKGIYLNLTKMKKLIKEVNKCIILCCNCHKELHRTIT